MARIATILGAAAIALVAGCGGGSDSSAPPVDGTKQISSVSPTDKTNLCTWFSNLAGGYGTVPACSMALLSAPDSEADCLDSFPTCTVTVSVFETCIRAVMNAQATCTSQAITTAQSTPECVTVGQAGCFN